MKPWLCILMVLAACSQAEITTQIVISVATDYDVPEDLRDVRFLVERQNGDPDDRVRFEHQEVLTGKDERVFPLTLALTSINKGKPVVRVTVTGQLANDSLVRREAIVSFRDGQALSLPMNLLRVCRNQLCVTGQTTCGESGRCESVKRDDLKTWQGEAPGIDAEGPGADGSIPDDAATEQDGAAPDPGVEGGIGSDAGDAGPTPEPNVVALSVGSHHSCAALRSGRVYCWGGNRRLALGSAATADECPDQVCTSPRLVPDVSDAIQLASGERYACALTRQGEVWCWGGNYNGQIGAAVNDDPLPPTRVRFRATAGGSSPFLAGVDALASGRAHVCARIAATKSLVCWGAGPNEYRQIPAEVSELNVAVPTNLTSGVERFGLGHYHGCYISSSGALSCWGWNSDAQVGIAPAVAPDPQYVLTPATIFATGVTDVAAGEAHTCAIVAGEVRCFGLAAAGQLGFGPLPVLPECRYGRCTPPRDVAEAPSASPPLSLALGERLSCARYQDNRVACWGSNEQGRAGQSAPEPILSPTFVPNLEGARILAAGFNHVCAATAEDILCWGANDEGQLGPSAVLGVSSAQLNSVAISEVAAAEQR